MILVDTNVLIYAFDQSAGRKRQLARELMSVLERSSEGFLTTQVLNEFYSNATRKIKVPLSEHEAETIVRLLVESWIVLPVTQSTVLEGIRGTREHQLHFWDGIIWASAKLNGIEIVVTEDFIHNRVVEGVRYINPFL